MPFSPWTRCQGREFLIPRQGRVAFLLFEVAREAIQDRVPPRSWERQKHFWECSQCRQLFWHGSHWDKITQRLHQAVS